MSDAETIDRPGTALVPVEKMTALQVFRPGGVEDVIARIKREIAAVEIDISTVAGRKACASLAYKIARSKTALDEMGKQLNEQHRAAINSVDAERRRIRSELDALAEQVRQPLTDYENAEKERVAGHERALATMEELGSASDADATPGVIDARLARLAEVFARDWQVDFRARAEKTEAAVRAALEAQKARAIQREAEAAELARLRKAEAERQRQEAERQQREREERIAREAAERARLEAEERAAAEARAAEERAEQERQAAARRQAEAERQAREAQERAAAAEQARKDAEAASERRRIEAEARAAREREEAAAQAQRDQEAAVAAERRRREQEEAAARAEADRRAKDKAHRGKINGEAALDLCCAADLTTKQAQAVVAAIALRKVRHVTVAY